jgi:hypothetical protein
MPRPSALSKVPTAALQAEVQRRVSRLSDLLKLREQVDKDIAELKVLAEQFGRATAIEAPNAKRRCKAKAAKAVAKLAARKGRRAPYAQTATEFVLGLLQGGKVLTSQELGQAWTEAGRKGMVAKTLGELVAKKKLARRKIRGKKGSKYRLA